MNPRLPFAHVALAATYALKGDTASASRHVTDLRKLAPTHTTDQLYRWFTGPGGKETHGQRYLQGLRMALNPGLDFDAGWWEIEAGFWPASRFSRH